MYPAFDLYPAVISDVAMDVDKGKPEPEEEPDFSHLPSYRVVNGQWRIVWPSSDDEQDGQQPEPASEETSHPSALLVFPYYGVREHVTTPAPVRRLKTDEMVFPYYKPVDTAWTKVWPYQKQAERQGTVGPQYPYFNLCELYAVEKRCVQLTIRQTLRYTRRSTFIPLQSVLRRRRQRRESRSFCLGRMPRSTFVSPDAFLMPATMC